MNRKIHTSKLDVYFTAKYITFQEKLRFYTIILLVQFFLNIVILCIWKNCEMPSFEI